MTIRYSWGGSVAAQGLNQPYFALYNPAGNTDALLYQIIVENASNPSVIASIGLYWCALLGTSTVNTRPYGYLSGVGGGNSNQILETGWSSNPTIDSGHPIRAHWIQSAGETRVLDFSVSPLHIPANNKLLLVPTLSSVPSLACTVIWDA